uniref:AlgS n=1 Tax=Sphingomonas sp. TaxID=28214 RepID=UPI00066EFF92|nr:Chain S, AlgS [Sphingomonas sp.]4TQU_T Chain T, AlgS [Sphingomonas sp.]4TQV_C Chain C, AlgS [Sphingomonas sp.]4TQV_D Chain D, AlgS [Sphingomonas sp.]4TQV_G Chain G, AlgS [Sphingomonas sp.]4TQV_H Chain H, AlgS [Sphingomonas sp.]4TQV_K Chain K, AlgS [Sphingomonas sp.]4TQV_L Chain L, AlgS [Sphingomonas sp.]4TQV_O Chain O, AlgS [Sphingomonas sp.]4TQV_P Chain P, AlgS [Sphingomonas sp.]4XIG_S Chain S, AlgS [Sphingomonas sp. A1]4XIG_T Chain T, AlgS [Sphingomonas sp. A1]4XTC_S Chain S, AlgS 
MVASVSIQNVVKRYDKTTVVHGVSLDIEPGEFVVLVGPSGCGKSTTLRMVAGLEEISGGTIRIDGRVINDLAPKDRDVAMVFQNYALYPHLNVRDNISFGLRLKRTKKSVIDAAVKTAADILGLQPLLERKPSDLSGGQRQRVAMGRAIVRDPKVFLFDQPLSNLDAKLRTQMRAEIKRLHQRLGTTVIYVTHDQVEAMTLADRIVVMRDGLIEQIGKPMDLFLHPANTFVASFIGSPPMNLMPARIAVDSTQHVELNGGNRISLLPRAGTHLAPGQEVVFGIRPEDVTLDGVEGSERAQIKATVDIVEPLGSESILHATVGDHSLVVKVGGLNEVHPGDPVTLHVDLTRVHLFDAQSQASIY